MRTRKFPEAGCLAGLLAVLLLTGGSVPAAGQDKNSDAAVILGGWVDKEPDIAGYEQLVRLSTGVTNITNMLQARRK